MARYGRPNPVTMRDMAIFVAFLTIVFLVSVLVTSFDIRMRAIKEVPANIVVDVAQRRTTINHDFFHAFSQGGEEKGNMLKPVASSVAGLRPKYIRLDHIYDGFDIVGGNPTNLSFDWTRLDDALDTIISLGATPVLSLSYMPGTIAKDGVITNPPTDWQSWSYVVQKTVEHISGTKQLSGVYYEIWNEPDLDQFGSWKTYGPKNYLTLYRYAADGAAKAKHVKPFYIGGPSTTGLYKSWIERLLELDVRVDFLSWHFYNSSPLVFRENIEAMQSWGQAYDRIRTKSILVTEVGFSGKKDGLYGSKYAAAYTAAVVRQAMDAPLSPIIFTFQLKDGPSQSNGWGMIGHQDSGATTKPRYHAFSFIDQMQGVRLGMSGEGSWITGFAALDSETIRVLLTNVDPNTPGKPHTERVPIMFVNARPGTYTVRLLYFMGANTTRKIISTNNILQTDVYMLPNQMAIVELKHEDNGTQ